MWLGVRLVLSPVFAYQHDTTKLQTDYCLAYGLFLARPLIFVVTYPHLYTLYIVLHTQKLYYCIFPLVNSTHLSRSVCVCVCMSSAARHDLSTKTLKKSVDVKKRKQLYIHTYRSEPLCDEVRKWWQRTQTHTHTCRGVYYLVLCCAADVEINFV